MPTPQRPIGSGFGTDTTVAEVLEGIDLSGRLVLITGGYSGLGLEDTRALDAPRGWESQFATNHLGHFALTNLLWPALAADGGARVVSLSSRGHKRSDIRWDDLEFRTGYDKWQAYGQAKTANVLFAVELDRLGQDAGVRAFAVHPGGILTPLQRHLERSEMVAFGWIDEDGNQLARFKTPEQGAATAAWAATSPRLEGMGGVYCEDCDIAEVADPSTEEGQARGVNAYAIDPDSAQRLWRVSAELTGVDAFAASA
jgi:NAD(P)-dependent dehydrogenase (short-subunit alcohol dehydrogenase family)